MTSRVKRSQGRCWQKEQEGKVSTEGAGRCGREQRAGFKGLCGKEPGEAWIPPDGSRRSCSTFSHSPRRRTC